MKEKILMLIIGILIGAIITTGVFLILNQNNSSSQGRGQMGNRPEGMGNFTPGDMNSIPQGGRGENQSTTSTTNQTTSSSNSL